VAGLLLARGYRQVETPDAASLILYNTCSIREKAAQKVFSRLGELVKEVEQAGADRIHVDVMDGHFVPNLSMGPIVVEGLRPVTRLPLEVHLMVEDPAKFVDPFIKAGADSLIVHLEVLPDPRPLVKHIHDKGKKVGMTIKPDSPIARLEPYLKEVDLALCMTVYPGFGGQQFLPESPGRIRELRVLINRLNPQCDLEVDGGIDVHNAPLAVEAGANVLVSGSGVFKFPKGPAAAVRELLSIPR
jgi:ribulose-phosphate 3-epimerase